MRQLPLSRGVKRYWTAMGWLQKTILVLSTFGLLVLVLNMFGNRPAYVSYSQLQDESQMTLSTSPESLLDKAEESELDADLKRKLEAQLWGKPGVVLEPCWSSHLPKRIGKSWGFVFITTSNGPHNHRAQIADAVVVASQLGASLILPTIKEALREPNSRFEDIYNVRNFISSLDGIVRVVGKFPKEMENVTKTITSIPLRVSREYIDEQVRPIFKQNGGLVFLGTFLPAIKTSKVDEEVAAMRCLVMHKALQYVLFIQKLGDRLMNRLREAAPESSGKRFVAVDLKLDLLQHKACNVTDASRKRCLEPKEVGQFLKNVGYSTETALYLTQSRWSSSLESIQDMFPNLHTKEYSMPFNEENQYLYPGTTQFEQALDFYICSRSDVFVPTVPGSFYTHVTGERISVGLNHIILPAVTSQRGSINIQLIGVLSPYVEKKNHPVHACFCEPSLSPPKNSSKEVALPSLEVSSVAVMEKEPLEKKQKRTQKVVSLLKFM